MGVSFTEDSRSKSEEIMNLTETLQTLSVIGLLAAIAITIIIFYLPRRSERRKK